MPVNSVCRTCLDVIPDGKTGHNLDDEDSSENIREIITLCVPEMDTYVSTVPCICDTCYNILVGFYHFKVRCLQVESAIRSHMESKNLQEGGSVDLHQVARLQALEALKQKNWSLQVGRKLVASVDKCLNPKKQLPKVYRGKVDASSPDGFIRVRTNLMPDKQGAGNNLTVNPLNIWASKAAAKKKRYKALQLCPVSGVLGKLKVAKRASESDDVIFVDSQQDSDDEVVVINDDQEANTSKAKKVKRQLNAPIVVDAPASKRRKLQLNRSSGLSSGSSKTGEKKLVVNLRKEQLFKCSFCQYVTLELLALKTHYFQLHKVCKLCEFKCSRFPTLHNHISQRHRAELQLTCKFYHTNIACNFLCSLCRFAGKNLIDLVQHRLTKHIKLDEKLGAYRCPFAFCQFQHFNATNVAEHVADKHDKLDRKECLMCNFCGTSMAKIHKHVLEHDLTFYPCPICGFKCKNSLDSHMKKNHPDVNNEDGTTVGVVYDDVIQYDKLTSDDDFKVTLGPFGPQSHPRPQNVATAQPTDDQEAYHWAQPSLSEMLCGHLLSQEDQETINEVSDESETDVKSSRKRRRESAIDDSDDCVVVETERIVVTVESSDEDDEDAASSKIDEETLGPSTEKQDLPSTACNHASSEEPSSDPIRNATEDEVAEIASATECLENGVTAEQEPREETNIRDAVSESEVSAEVVQDMEKCPGENQSAPLEDCARKSVEAMQCNGD